MNRLIALLITAFIPFFISAQLYHENGYLASNGSPYSTFYHDNGRIAWFGQRNGIEESFFYKNGAIAWRGYFNRETSFSYDLCSVYHSNGNLVWRGCSNQEASFSYDPCSIYHDNGRLAWRGALNKDASYSYDPCTVYHGNGLILWRGATAKETSYSFDPSTIYHSNGAPAWRGGFSCDGYSANSITLYYDNGQITWRGRRGDPIYDYNGNLIQNAAEAVWLPLGEGSWLYVSYDGYYSIHLSIGNENFLIFSNLDPSPCLRMNLGPGYKLEFFPYTGDMPQLNVYEHIIPVRD